VMVRDRVQRSTFVLFAKALMQQLFAKIQKPSVLHGTCLMIVQAVIAITAAFAA
jgi:hypothetical protein